MALVSLRINCGASPYVSSGWNNDTSLGPNTVSNLVDTSNAATTIGWQKAEAWTTHYNDGTVGTTGLPSGVYQSYVWWTLSASTRTCKFTGLTNGATYTIRIHYTEPSPTYTTRFVIGGVTNTWTSESYVDWTGLAPSGGEIAITCGGVSTYYAGITAIELIQTAEAAGSGTRTSVVWVGL